MTVLRTYQHVAQKEHWCDNCCNYIQPGEMYEGTIVVMGKYDSKGISIGKQLVVFKQHIHPRCEEPEEPEYHEEKDNELEETVKEEMRKAA